MSLRQMEYFVTVVQEASFTRAADALHVTQPALSHQIKALEKSVGGALLERLPRGCASPPWAARSCRTPNSPSTQRRAGPPRGPRHRRRRGRRTTGRGPALHRGRRPCPTSSPAGAWRTRGSCCACTSTPPPRPWRRPCSAAPPTSPSAPSPPAGPAPWCPSARRNSSSSCPSTTGSRAVRRSRSRNSPTARGSAAPWNPSCTASASSTGRAGRPGSAPRTAVWTEHTSTAVRMAAAGVGVCRARPHRARRRRRGLRGAHPPTRPGGAPLTVYARVPPTGAAAAFVDLLRATWPALRTPGPYEDCVSPEAQPPEAQPPAAQLPAARPSAAPAH